MLFSGLAEGPQLQAAESSQKRDAGCPFFAKAESGKPGQPEWNRNFQFHNSFLFNSLQTVFRYWHAASKCIFTIQPRKTNDTDHHLHGLPAHLWST